MKKILFLSALNCIIFTVNAQNTYYAPTNAKPVSGVVEPTINGIPYSQYAAQGKAQQLQKTSPPVVPYQFKLPDNPPKWNPADKKALPANNVVNAPVKTTEEKRAQIKAGQVEMDKMSAAARIQLEEQNKFVPSGKTVQETKPVYEIPKPLPGSRTYIVNNTTQTNPEPAIMKQSPSNNTKIADNTRVSEGDDSKGNGTFQYQAKPVVVENSMPVTSTSSVPASTINLSVSQVITEATNIIANPSNALLNQFTTDNNRQVKMEEVPKLVVPAEKPKAKQ